MAQVRLTKNRSPQRAEEQFEQTRQTEDERYEDQRQDRYDDNGPQRDEMLEVVDDTLAAIDEVLAQATGSLLGRSFDFDELYKLQLTAD